MMILSLSACSSTIVDFQLSQQDSATEDANDGTGLVQQVDDGGLVLPCTPKIVNFIDDAGILRSVTFPCLSGGSTSRGTSDPAGWGNDNYEPNEPPPADFLFPPRNPPGDLRLF